MATKSDGNNPMAVQNSIYTQAPELGPKPVEATPKQRLDGGDQPAKQATAAELLGYLLESGSPPAKLAEAQSWIKANPASTALELLRFLEDAEERGKPPTSPGTLRKAGKWLWGSEWEPSISATNGPGDDVDRLRQQVAAYEAQAAVQNTELAATKTQIDYLRGENARLKKEIDARSADKPT